MLKGNARILRKRGVRGLSAWTLGNSPHEERRKAVISGRHHCLSLEWSLPAEPAYAPLRCESFSRSSAPFYSMSKPF